MNHQTVFTRGIPTRPDVQKLMTAFPNIEIGQTITHQQIEAAGGLTYSTNRYIAVTAAWRKELLAKHDIEMGAVPGIGFKRLNAAERIDTNITGMHHGLRKTARSAKRVGMVLTDDAALQHRRDVAVRAAAVLTFEHQRMTQELKRPQTARASHQLTT